MKIINVQLQVLNNHICVPKMKKTKKTRHLLVRGYNIKNLGPKTARNGAGLSRCRQTCTHGREGLCVRGVQIYSGALLQGTKM